MILQTAAEAWHLAKEFWDGREDGKDNASKMDLANNKVGYGLAKNSSFPASRL